jgi:hypothetical protein
MPRKNSGSAPPLPPSLLDYVIGGNGCEGIASIAGDMLWAMGARRPLSETALASSILWHLGQDAGRKGAAKLKRQAKSARALAGVVAAHRVSYFEQAATGGGLTGWQLAVLQRNASSFKKIARFEELFGRIDEGRGTLPPLHMAAAFGMERETRLLIAAGANPALSAYCAYGDEFELDWTPLMLAARSGSKGVLELLIPLASPEKRGAESGTALMQAALAGEEECLGMLLAAGCDPCAVDGADWSALMCASAMGHASCVDLLLPVSALGAKNSEGSTASGCAREVGHDVLADRIEAFALAKAERARIAADLGVAPAQPCAARTRSRSL